MLAGTGIAADQTSETGDGVLAAHSASHSAAFRRPRRRHSYRADRHRRVDAIAAAAAAAHRFSIAAHQG